MEEEYLNIYNNLIKLTRNKSLYQNLDNTDTFSDRLIVFLFHFAFFLKKYKNDNSKSKLQIIYDFNFKQIELSIREIGYGDVSINKQMKIYINLFHSIIEKIEKWDSLDIDAKSAFFSKYLKSARNTNYLINYFEKYRTFLTKNTLNYFSNDIIEPKI